VAFQASPYHRFKKAKDFSEEVKLSGCDIGKYLGGTSCVTAFPKFGT